MQQQDRRALAASLYTVGLVYDLEGSLPKAFTGELRFPNRESRQLPECPLDSARELGKA